MCNAASYHIFTKGVFAVWNESAIHLSFFYIFQTKTAENIVIALAVKKNNKIDNEFHLVCTFVPQTVEDDEENCDHEKDIETWEIDEQFNQNIDPNLGNKSRPKDQEAISTLANNANILNKIQNIFST